MIRRVARAARSRLRGAQRRAVGSLVRVHTQDPVAALTFDDGPHPEYTPRLLEILERRSARATFFMVGESARKHREIVEQVAATGHAIGNHTWDHPEFPAIGARERRDQLRACSKATAPYGERLFRPPYVLQSFASFLTARRLGYQVVAFNVEVEDWRNPSAGRMADRMAARIKPGSIMVLHDAIYRASMGALADRTALLEAVDDLLDRLDGRFEFVTLPELLRRGEPVYQPWFFRTHADWPDHTKETRC